MAGDPVTGWIMEALGWISVIAGLYALLHAAIQRADAFTAADKMSKPKWVGITAGGTAACALAAYFAFIGILFLLWIAGLVAVLVYLVDVRPKLIDVQRGSR